VSANLSVGATLVVVVLARNLLLFLEGLHGGENKGDDQEESKEQCGSLHVGEFG
jgi:hypothetical protein